MDGNKEEAARCIRIAEAALAAGDKQRVLKFIRIARRLDDNIPLEGLLAACEKLGSGHSISTAEETLTDRATKEPSTSKSSDHSNGGERNYTEEHVKLIREIKGNKDYYAILGVEKSCSVEEIRRAYRKLSLKVHPDKNNAPGSEEAFKTICKAFKCLSDEESRRQYDQTGFIGDLEFDQQYSNMRRRRRRATRNDMFNENFDPDEIFRSFFFGSQGDVFRTPHVYRTRGMASQRRESNAHGGGISFINLLQILLFLLLFLFAYLPFSEPDYSLQKTYTYQISKVTEKHGVRYYVKSADFDQQYPHGSPSRENLERVVLKDHRSLLGRYCHVELQRRLWARNYPTPYCDKLRSLVAA